MKERVGKKSKLISEENQKSNYHLDLLPEVEYDVEEAYSWYESQLLGLGEDLLHSIDVAIAQIIKDPLLFQKIYKNVRKVNARKFPFGVFYILKKNIITIIAVQHLARHPKTWRKRIRG